MVRVSVVIPVFNQERYLGMAIESVLAQTFRDFELIIVDDGSTDGTPNVIGRYGEQVRPFHKPNGGGASALNLGIREARGEWIAWLSSDDVWEPTKLARQMAAVQANPAAEFVFTDDLVIDSDGNVLQRRHFSVASSRNRRLLQLARGCFINGSSTLIRRDVFHRVGYFDERDRLTYDYDLWFRIVQQCELLNLPEPLIRYRVHGTQGSHNYEGMMLAWHRVLSRWLRRLGPALGAIATALIVKDELMVMPWRIKRMRYTGQPLSHFMRRITGLFKVLVSDSGAS